LVKWRLFLVFSPQAGKNGPWRAYKNQKPLKLKGFWFMSGLPGCFNGARDALELKMEHVEMIKL